MTQFISYYRVSTQRQGRSGLGLEAQQEAVRKYLATVPGAEIVTSFTEIESGKNPDRAQLRAALAICRARRATLLVAKLDRLARNLAFLTAIMDSGVDFICADNPNANKLTIHILGAMAEYERECISARTKAALAAAKARGVKLGGHLGPNHVNPTDWHRQRAAQVSRELAAKRARDIKPILEGLTAQGITDAKGQAAALNEMGVVGSRGGRWHGTSVLRYRRRLLSK